MTPLEQYETRDKQNEFEQRVDSFDPKNDHLHPLENTDALVENLNFTSTDSVSSGKPQEQNDDDDDCSPSFSPRLKVRRKRKNGHDYPNYSRVRRRRRWRLFSQTAAMTNAKKVDKLCAKRSRYYSEDRSSETYIGLRWRALPWSECFDSECFTWNTGRCANACKKIMLWGENKAEKVLRLCLIVISLTSFTVFIYFYSISRFIRKLYRITLRLNGSEACALFLLKNE